MNKTYARYSVPSILLAPSILLLGLAAGCASAAETDEQVGGKEIIPSEEVFEFAPDGEEVAVEKEVQDDALVAKGSTSRVYGSTFNTPVTIGINQTVNFSTSGGSVGVDPVLVLFRRHDNSTTFSAFPYTQRVGIQTLAINDDSNGTLHSTISYTNTSGQVENAFLMVFAWANSTGQVTLSGGFGLVNVAAGSVLTSGTAGQASTSGSNGDPWLFTFDTSSGGNGVWNDDSSSNPVNRESLITGATSLTMWYVAHGFNSGTTTINY